MGREVNRRENEHRERERRKEEDREGKKKVYWQTIPGGGELKRVGLSSK